MLKIEGLRHELPGFQLGPLDLEVAGGECHVLLGPSGSGKSTLLELIVGFRRPREGRIYLDGADVTASPSHRRGVGYLPQRLCLFPHLSVRGNIEYGYRHRTGGSPDPSFLLHLAEELQIGHLLDRRPGSLSGGEAQRVALARAVASQPRLLVLDEPFGALNETLRRDLWRLLRRIQREAGLSVLMVTHDLEEAFTLGEYLSVLIAGRIHQRGRREEVYYHPASLDVARFLGAANLFDVEVVEVSPQGWRVRWNATGRHVTLPHPPGDATEFAPGAPAVLGIREEHVALEAPPLGEECTVLQAEVQEVDFLRGAYRLILRCPEIGGELRVRVSPRDWPGRNHRNLAVWLPHRHCFLVADTRGPGESGRMSV
ncbi:MAG: ABC transporter ATP-binding protein [Acidobacteriota bacterium]